jgi:ketosteroid isomerase-like protein
MRLTTSLAVLLVGLAACASGFTACYGQTNSSDSGAPAEIQAAYQKMDSQYDQRDSSAVLTWYAPTLVLLDAGGKSYTRDQLAAHMAIESRMSQSIDSTTTIQSAHVQASGTTVVFTHKMSITTVSPKTGVLNTIQTSVNARDHWIEVGGSWKINRERILSASVEVNGQLVKGMSM